MAFTDEVRVIRKIRAAYLGVPARTLARRIVDGDFDLDYPLDTGMSLSWRPFFSTYSVIRRYDAATAKPRSRKTNAKVGRRAKAIA